MPDPDRLLNTLRRGIEAFQAQPGRKGRLVHLDQAEEVLVAGDLHGSLGNLRLLLERANLGQHPGRHLVLQELIHGPFRYPFGGDKSHQLLDLLAALKCQYPVQVHLLLGNHELAQWTNQWIAKEEDDLNELFRRGVEQGYGSRAADILSTYRELFSVVPVALRTPNRVYISHSLPRPARLETFDPAALEEEFTDGSLLAPGGPIHSLVWGRDTAPATTEAFLQKVDADWLITGHIPCSKGFDQPCERHLILDCQGAPAAYCLLPTKRPLAKQDLADSIRIL